MSDADNRTKSLREKAEELYVLGFSPLYFRLLLERNSVTEEDKKYIERLWNATTKRNSSKEAKLLQGFVAASRPRAACGRAGCGPAGCEPKPANQTNK